MGRRQSGRAAVGCRQNNLPGIFFPQIANDVNTGKIGFALAISDHVPVGIHVRAGRNQFIVGIKSDENKNAVGGELALLTGLGVLKIHCADTTVIGFDGGWHRIPDNLNIALSLDALLQQRTRPQGIPCCGRYKPVFASLAR